MREPSPAQFSHRGCFIRRCERRLPQSRSITRSTATIAGCIRPLPRCSRLHHSVKLPVARRSGSLRSLFREEPTGQRLLRRAGVSWTVASVMLERFLPYRWRAGREQLKWFCINLRTENGSRQGQNLAMTGWFVLRSLNSGPEHCNGRGRALAVIIVPFSNSWFWVFLTFKRLTRP